MFNDSSALRHKTEAAVIITVTGDAPFDATVFLAMGARLIDLLNDERAFIPVRRADGKTAILAKSQIISIIERERTEAEENAAEKDDILRKAEATATARRFDPYALLRVAPDATTEEIRTAYKSRIKAVHPDSVAGLEPDRNLEQAALKATQKLNYAYQKIMREREEAKVF